MESVSVVGWMEECARLSDEFDWYQVILMFLYYFFLSLSLFAGFCHSFIEAMYPLFDFIHWDQDLVLVVFLAAVYVS